MKYLLDTDSINRARNSDDVVKGYTMMARLVSDFKLLPLVSFDAGAATTFDRLQSQRIQLALDGCSDRGNCNVPRVNFVNP